MTQEDIAKLSEEFPKDKIGVKVNSFSKNKDRAMLVLYLQHTDVYSRIESVDPAWSCKATSRGTTGDGLHHVSMEMTIKGVSRENTGDGNDYKGAYSDALKRVAMLFGVGRYLYDQETVWVPYNESTDKYKSWTFEEFMDALGKKGHKISQQANSAASTIPNKLTVGKWIGKTFEEALKQDSAEDYNYTKWIYKQSLERPADTNQSFRDYITYAKQQGVEL